MTREQAQIIIGNIPIGGDDECYSIAEYQEAKAMAIKALEHCEVWNGIHGQVVAPKGTFDRIRNDAEKEKQETCEKCLYAEETDGAHCYECVKGENRFEPQTGHWEWLTEDKYRCSNCNHETRVDECMNEPMYDFCPFCGAKMESEVSE